MSKTPSKWSRITLWTPSNSAVASSEVVSLQSNYVTLYFVFAGQEIIQSGIYELGKRVSLSGL